MPMTILFDLHSPRSAPSFRTTVRRLAARLRCRTNGWIAELIARQERRAAIAILRRLDDRELKDIGLYRGDIGEIITNAARDRTRRRRAAT
jgi:uncharacterized protein YjiS (DUF1127 family)